VIFNDLSRLIESLGNDLQARVNAVEKMPNDYQNLIINTVGLLIECDYYQLQLANKAF